MSFFYIKTVQEQHVDFLTVDLNYKIISKLLSSKFLFPSGQIFGFDENVFCNLNRIRNDGIQDHIRRERTITYKKHRKNKRSYPVKVDVILEHLREL